MIPDIPAEFRPPSHDTPADLAEPVVSSAGVRTYAGIDYAKTFGYRPLRFDLLLPDGHGPHPVVLYIHGGAFLMGSRRENGVAAPLWRALLDAGIAIASVEYRLSGEARFPACVNDVSAAVRWLRAHGSEMGLQVDRIGAIGESAGGYLAAFLAMNSTDPAITGEEGATGVPSHVDVAVAWYPPTDLGRMDEQATIAGSQVHGVPDSPESLLIGEPAVPGSTAATAASPISHISPASAPLLLVHGEGDRVVPVGQSVALAAALTATSRPVELWTVPGADHVFEGVDRAPIIERSVAFLAAGLRPTPAA